jgi:hypothetical protein
MKQSKLSKTYNTSLNLDYFTRKIPIDNFRISHKKLLLEYDVKFDKYKIHECISEIIYNQNKKYIEKYFITSGNYKPSNKPITICIIILNIKYDSVNKKTFEIERYCPIIRYFTSPLMFRKCVNFVARNVEDDNPFVEDIDYEINTPLEQIWGHKDIKDAFSTALSMGETLTISEIYNSKPKENNKNVIKISKYKWQQNILSLKERKPNKHDYRLIHWYFDEEGDTEKTYFIRYLWDKFPEDCFGLKAHKKTDGYHVATLIDGALENGWNGKILLVDIPRRASNNLDIYEALECIKDTWDNTLKYKGKTLKFNNEYIFVFANVPPQLEEMSNDRWNVRYIDKKDYNDYDWIEWKKSHNIPLEIDDVKGYKDFAKTLKKYKDLFYNSLQSSGDDIAPKKSYVVESSFSPQGLSALIDNLPTRESSIQKSSIREGALTTSISDLTSSITTLTLTFNKHKNPKPLVPCGLKTLYEVVSDCEKIVIDGESF